MVATLAPRADLPSCPAPTATSIAATAAEKTAITSLLKDYRALSVAQRDDVARQLAADQPDLFCFLKNSRVLAEAGKITKVQAQGTPVALADLPQKLGWEPGGWQMKLLTALDEEPVGNKAMARLLPGKGLVSTSELVAKLRSPAASTGPTQRLTTSSLDRLKAELTRIAGPDQAGATISALTDDWKKQIVKRADPDGDGKVTVAQLEAYLNDHPAEFERFTLQNLGVMLHHVATLTGEQDPFRLAGLGAAETSIVRTAFAGSFNSDNKLSTVIQHVVTAEDIRQKKAFPRDDAFRKDDKLALGDQVRPSDYRDNTGEEGARDKGHYFPNADAATDAAAFESFLMSNMAPQTARLNRGAWRYLEDKTRDIIEGANGKAIIYTGVLYLNAQGKPMTPAELQDRANRTGTDWKMADPTHSFRSVLIRNPDGTRSTFSFMVENKKDLPIKEEECGALLRGRRVSIAELQELSGVKDFFAGSIPTDVAVSLKADKTSAPLLAPNASPDAKEAHAYLFGMSAASKVWVGARSSQENVAAMLVAARAIEQAKASAKAGAAATNGTAAEQTRTAGQLGGTAGQSLHVAQQKIEPLAVGNRKLILPAALDREIRAALQSNALTAAQLNAAVDAVAPAKTATVWKVPADLARSIAAKLPRPAQQP